MYDRAAMGGRVVFASLALVVAAGCHDQNPAIGCGGAAVLITVTPAAATDASADADAASPADGGAAANPPCAGRCDEYLEALRVAIESATPAVCVRRPVPTVLACAPSPNSPEACPRDTVAAATSLDTQIRDYLRASRPEIDPSAVRLDTCVCHADCGTKKRWCVYRSSGFLMGRVYKPANLRFRI
jgi:hypothetical protein